MNILWSIHLYYPHHCCGSEAMAHQINKYLVSRNHHCRVILHQSKNYNIRTPYTYEGVEVFGSTGHLDVYRWADVILTHLDYTQFSILMAHEVKKPLVHFAHNDICYTSIQNAAHKSYVVYNSEWIAKALNYKWPSIVFPPPCDVDYYGVNKNPQEKEAITLISLNGNKGAELFYKIAEAMPDRKFIGVRGGYDEQLIRTLPNIELLPNSPNILSVYERTRILLMPSAYESWGRTATEAMCSGIPVICTPTPGLKENCGDAGIYVGKQLPELLPGEPQVDRGNVEDWVGAIKKLDDPKEYLKKSKLCKSRALRLRPDFLKMEKFLIGVVEGAIKYN